MVAQITGGTGFETNSLRDGRLTITDSSSIASLFSLLNIALSLVRICMHVSFCMTYFLYALILAANVFGAGSSESRT